MSTKDKLDIFIITYNRDESLENTLKQLLDENSPVKDCDIEIIDNNSKDNTSQVVQKYQEQHKNIQYVKNKYNIGANANIVKAFYKASKEYVWVLADNDNYFWESWSEVEEAMEANKSAIMVADYAYPDIDVMHFVNQATFLPAVIYKTSEINDTVMGNMTFNISNMFPHVMLFFKLLNENKEIPICTSPIVAIGNNIDKKTNAHIYTRGYSDLEIHPLQKNMSWDAGFANSLYLLKNKNIKNFCIQNRFNGPALNTVGVIKRQKNLYNVMSIFSVLNFWDKIKYLIKLLYSNTLIYVLYISPSYTRKGEKSDIYYKRWEIKIFNSIKIRTKKKLIKRDNLIKKQWTYEALRKKEC